jgi:hypothetical protein
MTKTKKNVQKKRRRIRKKTRGRKIKGGAEDPPSRPGPPNAYVIARAWAIKNGFGQWYNVKYYTPGFQGRWDLFRTCSIFVDVPKVIDNDLKFDLYYLLWECNHGIASPYSINNYEIDVPNLTIHVLLNSKIPYVATRDEQMKNQ